MDKDIYSRVQNWITENISLVSAKHPVSIHIDELLGRKFKGQESLRISLDAFEQVINILLKNGVPVQPSLTIILESESKKIELNIPKNRKEIVAQLAPEPPSVYLVSWDASKYLSVIEEYKTPLPFDLLLNEVEGVITYYIEYRGSIGIENDWEFSRAIYLDYYPEKFR